jgi:GAF domain-containing protein
VRLFDEVQAKTRDLEESLAQQTATADVLKVISRSAFDLDAVLNTLAESARSLSGAAAACVLLRDGELLRLRAESGCPPEFTEYVRAHPPRRGRRTGTGRVLMTGETVHIPDVLADREYSYGEGPRLGAYRAQLGVPLIRNEKVEGVFGLLRPDPGAFTARQIELVTTFADQAVIAIENVRLFEEVQAKTRDLEEALAQQTATADVLKAISRSAFNLDAVLNTLTESARSLSGAAIGAVFVRDGEAMRIRAESGFPAALIEYAQAHPIRAGPQTLVGRVVLTGEAVHMPDVLGDPEYDYGDGPRLGNYRAGLGVPLLRAGGVEGVFVLMRPQRGPFTPRQIEMASAFADQTVIAIENVRLFEEVQAKTRDLEESLAQQTATADVLKVISRSAFDLDAVLRTLVESAAKLCEADKATITREINGVFYRTESYGFSEEFMAQIRHIPVVPERGSISGLAMLECKAVQVADVEADPEYWPKSFAETGELRTGLGIPMMRNGAPIGVLALMRSEVRGFNDKQIELVQTFADQAVIAIENARLFGEVQARTREVEESLAQQTATAEVLKVISRSAFDLQTVLDTLVASAVQLNGAKSGTICVREGDAFRYRAFAFPDEPQLAGYLQAHPPAAGRGSIAGRVILSGEVEEIPDVLADPEYEVPIGAQGSPARALIAVPLIGKDRLEGVYILSRVAPGSYSPRQIEILKTFADQAVIAIENSRLFNEVQAKTRDLEESLSQQTATADVLKAISRSAFDLQTVLDTLVGSAVALCNADAGVMFQNSGDTFYGKAFGGNLGEEFVRYFKTTPQRPGRATASARVLLTGEVQNIADIRADPEYDPEVAAINRQAAALGVPLLRDRTVIGAIVVGRATPGVYSQREVELVQTFADQAVIAIENARLFGEVQARTSELAASLDDLRKAQDRLIQSEKLASLGQLTAGIAHEIKNPLNFINNFSGLSRELMDELRGVLEKAPLDGENREEAQDLIGMIDANLDKVVAHGKRADSIVKNMLLHSREGSGERGPANINAMVEEALNLAYHGARAEKRGFNVTIEKALDPAAGEAELYLQEITRVLLNLISNAFYATTKRKESGTPADYEPTLFASTRDLGHSVEIAIRDNGMGIADEVKAKMFNPFFTTKPAGEGTGLGLSLSHDIVVKQHGGTIEVATEPGVFTAFTITLPRRGPR